MPECTGITMGVPSGGVGAFGQFVFTAFLLVNEEIL